MSPALTIRNRHKTRPVDTRLLRRVTISLLSELLVAKSVELGITLVAAPEMARINWQFLQHEGSTDVITFDHTATQESRQSAPSRERQINGELFICLDDAVAQARRFRTSWQAELMRYVVHGILHLLGHDDHRPAARHTMKREENRMMRLLAAQFDLAKLRR